MKSHRPIVLAALLALSGAGLSQAADKTAAPNRATLAKLCSDCAIVRGVRTETRKGKPSGLGIVGGAVAGGALGNQIGRGSGRTIATFGGAVGGGLLGNEVEKNLKKTTVWITTVTLKDGSVRHFEAANDPHLRAGDVVHAVQGQLRRA
ncbi:MAG: glycine zipper 2TM domain-containing protein [Burkholderiaceae bacterium]